MLIDGAVRTQKSILILILISVLTFTVVTEGCNGAGMKLPSSSSSSASSQLSSASGGGPGGSAAAPAAPSSYSPYVKKEIQTVNTQVVANNSNYALTSNDVSTLQSNGVLAQGDSQTLNSFVSP